MKQPQNFTFKVNDFIYNNPVKGMEFRFEVGSNSDEQKTELWVFDDSSHFMKKYCTLFKINWIDNNYEIRKCLKGEGYQGKDIATGNLDKRVFKTFDMFIQHIVDTITTLSSGKHYTN